MAAVPGEEIPAEILEFIHSCIDSVEQLRVLLLLRSEPDRVWTTAEITSELRSSDGSITKRLNDLYARKVLTRGEGPKDRHRFNPSTPELREVVRKLDDQNQLRPYRIIEAIYSQPNKALKAFADSFKLRGDDQ